MFQDDLSPPCGCIVDHEMSCKSIMHSEFTRHKSIGVHCVAVRRTETYSTHEKSHFQTQNGPLTSFIVAQDSANRFQTPVMAFCIKSDIYFYIHLYYIILEQFFTPGMWNPCDFDILCIRKYT